MPIGRDRWNNRPHDSGEPHLAIHVGDDLGKRVPRLAAVDHGKNRIATIEQLLDQAGLIDLVGRESAAR